MENQDGSHLDPTRVCRSDQRRNEHVEFSESERESEMIDKARSAIILCLGDKALREVAREKTTASMWLKLESCT